MILGCPCLTFLFLIVCSLKSDTLQGGCAHDIYLNSSNYFRWKNLYTLKMVLGNPVGGNGRGEGFDGREREFNQRMDSLRRREEEAKRRQV